MKLYPAIDLRGGQAVRLYQGDYDQMTVYNADPVAQAQQFIDAGAQYLHVVDLDGAKDDTTANLQTIAAIAKLGGLKIEVGGGIRDEATIEAYLSAGVTYCIIGTQAVKEPVFVERACRSFPGQIMVGLDAKDGQVAIEGWAQVTEHQAEDLAKRFEDAGVAAIIYTDIGRDGMMNGPNVEATRALAGSIRIPVIASGGITVIDDVRALAEVASCGIIGAITGRAIYEGTLDFAEGQRLADSLSPR